MDSGKNKNTDNKIIKSSLVRIIEKGGFTSYIPMLSIFFLLLYLVFLMILWIKLYENHECVFATGPDSVMCCHTHLTNSGKKNTPSFIELSQIENYKSNLMSPEKITFTYPGADRAQETIILTINYTDVPSGGTNYSSTIGSSAGYDTFIGGVSVYLKYYQDNPDEWEHSYGVVTEGMSVYVANNIPNSVFIVPASDGFDYVSPSLTVDGNISVTSDVTGTSVSYFSQLDTSQNFKISKNLSSDLTTYNPYINFADTKKSLETSGCSSGNTQECMCVDPGAQSLPPCDFKVNGKYLTNGGTCQSQNCSYSSQVEVPKTAGKGGNIGQTHTVDVAPNISKGSTLGNAVSIQVAESIHGSGSAPPPPLPTIHIGNPLDSNTLPVGDISNAYVPDKIFCGIQTSTGPSIMYPENVPTSNPTAKNNSMLTTTPNVKLSSSGGPVRLGFN